MTGKKSRKMRNRIFTGIVFVLVLSAVLIVYMQQNPQKEEMSIRGFKLNTAVRIVVYDSGEEELLDKAMALCDRYEKIFSSTRADSELYQLNHGELPQEDGWYVLSEECAELIEKGLYYSQLSEGAFDITVEPVSSLWDFTSEMPVVPDEQEIKEAKELVGYQKTELDGNRIRFAQEGMGIELGAIAKGYIADRIKEFLLANGVKSGIIDLGGNILCIGERSDGDAFRIGIQKPFAERSDTIGTAMIRGKSVVSSGIYERYFEQEGRLYHHILNPGSGYPYENELTGVTIVSEQSVDGDALSTTCFALGLEKGMELINRLPEVQAVFITKDGKVHFSQEFEEETSFSRLK